jgi:hypothetical protein
MTDDQTAVITTKDVSNTRIDADHILVIGAEGGPSGLEASVAAGVSAYNNPGVEEAYERAEREYDPAEYDSGTVVARIQPDGTTEWPLEADQ